MVGTPSFGYGDAGTPGLDTQTPGTVDPYQHGMGAPTPGIGMTPAFTESSGLFSSLPAVFWAVTPHQAELVAYQDLSIHYRLPSNSCFEILGPVVDVDRANLHNIPYLVDLLMYVLTVEPVLVLEII
jgi:hypothetical protein